jgi:hypothetical protein
MQWYLKAAALDYSPSMTSLGGMYRDGRGVETNSEEAKKWLDKAAAIEAVLHPPPPPPAEPACGIADLDITLHFNQDSDNTQTVAIELRNISKSSCRVEAVRPDLRTISSPGPPMEVTAIKTCQNCTSDGGWSPSPLVLAPDAAAHEILSWSATQAKAGTGCVPLYAMNILLYHGQTAVSALDLNAGIAPPQVCSTVDVGALLPGLYTPPPRTGRFASAPQPGSLQVAADETTFFPDERLRLRVSLEELAPAVAEAGKTCPVLLQRTRFVSGLTQYVQLGGDKDFGCRVLESRVEDSRRYLTLQVTRYIPSFATLGENSIQFFQFTSPDNSGWNLVAASNEFRYRVADAKTIARGWGPQVKGLAIDLTLEKKTYWPGGEIPIHMAVGNFGASQPISIFTCGYATVTLRDVDGQQVPPYGESGLGCVGNGREPPPLTIGQTRPIERSFEAPRQPGTYTLTASWTAYPSRGGSSPGLVQADDPNEVIQPYAIVRSEPVAIRVVDEKNPGVGAFTPSAPWPADFEQVDTTFGPKTALKDKLIGLKWLHLDLTANRSYKEMLASLQPGGLFAGWRFATADEVRQMFAHFDGAPEGASGNPAIEAILQGALGGPLEIFGGGPGNGQHSSSAGVINVEPHHTYQVGYIAKDIGPPGTSFRMFQIDPGVQQGWDASSDPGTTFGTGSYLVQKDEASPHP